MADLQGLFVYPGIERIISGDYTLCHGITPGVATLTIVPQAAIPVLTGDLAITFGNTALALPDFRVNRYSFSYTESGLIWRLQMWDKRWRWKFGFVTGTFNVHRQKFGQWDDTLDTSTKVKPHDLARRCLLAMGEPKYDLSMMPNDRYAQVNWDYDRPANALSDLVDSMGCRIILRIDGTVMIAPAGVGVPLPENDDVIQQSLGVEPATIPDSIMAVGGPTRYQADFLLEPCGLDVDGHVRGINEVSYAPAEGWGTNGGNSPPLFYGIADGITRELAKESIFKWFRIPPKPVGLDDKPLKIPGYGVVKVREQILPIEDEQVETFIDIAPVMQVQNGEVAVPVTTRVPKNKPALVWGYHPSENEKRTPMPAFGIQHPGSFVPSATEAEAKIRGGYSIDREFGIVKFANYQRFATLTVPATVSFGQGPVGKVINDFLNFAHICPSVLALRCAVCVRDPAGKTPDRYTRSKRLSFAPKSAGRSTGPMVLRHDEIVLHVWGDRPGLDNAVQGVLNNKHQGTLAGAPGVDEQLDYYINAALQQFQVLAPYEIQYRGIQRIDLDGGRQTVTWTVGEAGAFTTATWNTEMNRVPIPYKERRLFEALNREEVEQMRKAGQDARDARARRFR